MAANYSSSEAEEEEIDSLELINIKVEAGSNFMLTKLVQFKEEWKTFGHNMSERMSKMEQKQLALEQKEDELQRRENILIDKETDVNAKRKELPVTPSSTDTLTPNPMKKRVKTALFVPPEEISDMEEDWQARLKSYANLSKNKAERLTLAQLAFFLHWVGNRKNLAANQPMVMLLIREGIEAKVWTKTWTPSPQKTLSEYLLNKIKNIVSKRRKLIEEKKLQDQFDNMEKGAEFDITDYMSA